MSLPGLSFSPPASSFLSLSLTTADDQIQAVPNLSFQILLISFSFCTKKKKKKTLGEYIGLFSPSFGTEVPAAAFNTQLNQTACAGDSGGEITRRGQGY